MATAGEESDEYAGWLSVRSRLAVIWKDQFVVIAADALHFYTSEDRTTLKRVVHLAGSRVASKNSTEASHAELASTPAPELKQPIDAESANAELAAPVQSPDPAFVIETANGKKLHLLAPSPEVAEAWIEAIERASKRDGSLEADVGIEGSNSLSRLAEGIDSWQHLRAGLAARMRSAMATIAAAGANAIRDRQDGKAKSAGRTVASIDDDEPLGPGLDTAQGCANFLDSDARNEQALEHARTLVDHFSDAHRQELEGPGGDEMKVEAWSEALGLIQETLTQQLLAANQGLHSCLVSETHMSQLNLAAESWIMERVHAEVWAGCTAVYSEMDNEMEATLEQLDHVDSRLLGVRKEHREAVVGDALDCFRSLNTFHSPLDKALVLQRTSRCMLDTIKRVTSSYSDVPEEDRDGFLPCADDLLSLYICLMAHAKVGDLVSNASYIDRFLHLNLHDYHPGELGYHVTTFLAACEYVRSNDIQSLLPLPASEDAQSREEVAGVTPTQTAGTSASAGSSQPCLDQPWGKVRSAVLCCKVGRFITQPSASGHGDLALMSMSRDVGHAYFSNSMRRQPEELSRIPNIPAAWVKKFAYEAREKGRKVIGGWGIEGQKKQTTT